MYHNDFFNQSTAFKKIDIDVEGQKVYVTTTLSSDKVLAILKETGREFSYMGIK